MAEPSWWLRGWTQLLCLLLHRLAPIRTVFFCLCWGDRRESNLGTPTLSPDTRSKLVLLHLCWAACLGSQDRSAVSLPRADPCPSRPPADPPSPRQPAEEEEETGGLNDIQVWGRKSPGRGDSEMGKKLGRVWAPPPCNYAGGCHWARGSSCMYPPDFATPVALPVLPSCPGLLARLAAAPGSAGLHLPVTALALRRQM